ncbi:MAG: hypothetical protein LUD51_02510 [Clostridia bacterium]|nr:hypothetical protein [Clostridia bacterium]
MHHNRCGYGEICYEKKLFAAACCCLTVAVLGSVAALAGCGLGSGSDMTDDDCAALQEAVSAAKAYEGSFTLVEKLDVDYSEIYEDSDETEKESSTEKDVTTYSFNEADNSYVVLDDYSYYYKYECGDDTEEDTELSVSKDYYTNGYRYSYSKDDNNAPTTSVAEYTLKTRKLYSCMEIYLDDYGSTVEEVREYFLGDEDEEESEDYSYSADVSLKVKGSTYTIKYNVSYAYDTKYGSEDVTYNRTYSYTVKNGYITAYTVITSEEDTEVYKNDTYTGSVTYEYSGTISYAYDSTLMPSAAVLATYGA